jgi:hypothetical protein
MVRDVEEPRTSFTIETTGPSVCIYLWKEKKKERFAAIVDPRECSGAGGPT